MRAPLLADFGERPTGTGQRLAVSLFGGRPCRLRALPTVRIWVAARESRCPRLHRRDCRRDPSNFGWRSIGGTRQLGQEISTPIPHAHTPLRSGLGRDAGFRGRPMCLLRVISVAGKWRPASPPQSSPQPLTAQLSCQAPHAPVAIIEAVGQ